MSIIDEVKQKSDIIEVIGQYTTLKKAGRLYRGLCPFHSEKTPSFFVYPEEQTWHCFGACNTGGDVFAFVMKKQAVGFGDALRFLADRKGVVIPVRAEREESKSEKDRLYEINQAATQFYSDLLIHDAAAEMVRGYLTKRGINLKTAVQFQLGYAPNGWEPLKTYLMGRGYTENDMLKAGLIIKADDGKTHDRFRHKLMIPVCDLKGRVSGFGSRVLDDSLPKYINSPQTPVFDKSGSLYGINHAVEGIRKQDRVVIVEGYMDVIIAHQYGITNVVASMGTAITEKQVNLINKITQNVVLALDPDTAGKQASLKGADYPSSWAVDLIEKTSEVQIAILPEGKDPDEIIIDNRDSWNLIINNAVPVIEYIIKTTITDLDLSKIKDKKIAIERILPFLKKIKENILRDHYLHELSKMTDTSYESLESSLARMQSDRFVKESMTQTVSRATSSILSSPIEEYVLALLLQHPELKQAVEPIPIEYFENTENREIYLSWMENPDISRVRELLDNVIREHLELILGKKISVENLDKKYNESSLRLREKYLKDLKRQEEQVLNLERETGGTDAELARLQERGTHISEDLRRVFLQRSQDQKR